MKALLYLVALVGFGSIIYGYPESSQTILPTFILFNAFLLRKHKKPIEYTHSNPNVIQVPINGLD